MLQWIMASQKELVKGRHGNFYAYADDQYLGQALSLYGEYGEEEAQFLLGLCPTDSICLEVGANAGYLTIPLARKYTVMAVEPQLCAYELLCENILVNGLERRITPVRAACGSEKGTVWIPDIGYEKAGNHGGINAASKQHGPYQLKVPQITVDSLVHEPIQLIKIDVEGMEYQVLMGALETIALYRPLLYIENDRLDKSEALIKLIWQLGYDCAFHTPELFNKDNYFKAPSVWPERLVSVNMICVPKEQNRLDNKVMDASYHPMKS